jgi:erythromycin esterase
MYRPALLRDAVAPVDPAYAARVFTLDSAHLALMPAAGAQRSWTAFTEFRREHRAALTAAYDSLADFLARHRAAIRRAHPTRPELPLVAERTARNAVDFLASDGGGAAGFNARDRGMADNVDFLLDSLYPGRRVVLWAHNAHVEHQGAPDAPPPAAGALTSMGSWIARRRRADVYTIGLMMYRGQAANNSRVTYDVALPHRAGSVESVLSVPRRQFLFVDLLGAPAGAWPWGRTVTKSWGRAEYALTPRADFDALLFVDTVRPPEYLPYATPSPAP